MYGYKDEKDVFHPINGSQSVVHASDVHSKTESAKIKLLKTKKFLEKAKAIKERAKKRREEKLQNLTERINKILLQKDANPDQKIEALQRLLNGHYKEMDNPMHERIKRELRNLHEQTDKAEHLQKESQEHRSENDPRVDFKEPKFIGNTANPKDHDEKIIGHDHQTGEAITSFGNRIQEHGKLPPVKPNESFSEYRERVKNYQDENKTIDKEDDGDNPESIEEKLAVESLKTQVGN